jgi:hypothetical protein
VFLDEYGTWRCGAVGPVRNAAAETEHADTLAVLNPARLILDGLGDVDGADALFAG